MNDTGSIEPLPHGSGVEDGDSATDFACFETYVERCLMPALRPDRPLDRDGLGDRPDDPPDRLVGQPRRPRVLGPGVEPDEQGARRDTHPKNDRLRDGPEH